MGNCQRRRAAQLPDELPDEAQAQAGDLAAQLDALTSVRRLPAKQGPGRPDTALSGLRYRFGCRWHYLHALKVLAGQLPAMHPSVRLAFLALRKLARQQHKTDQSILSHVKQLSGQ